MKFLAAQSAEILAKILATEQAQSDCSKELSLLTVWSGQPCCKDFHRYLMKWRRAYLIQWLITNKNFFLTGGDTYIGYPLMIMPPNLKVCFQLHHPM